MKLVVFNRSPNGRKTLAAARHLYLGAELEWTNVTSSGSSKQTFLKINPNGKGPALQNGDLCAWESNAILVYLTAIGAADYFLTGHGGVPMCCRGCFGKQTISTAPLECSRENGY
jgi:glutathione S-transferase